MILTKPLIIELYQRGLSTRQIAEQLQISKSGVWYVLKQANVTREQSLAAMIRQPAKSTHWRSTRCQARRIWERCVGPIPEGYEIHHRDGDHTNNAFHNLECLTIAEHKERHSGDSTPRHLRPARRAYMKAYLKRYNRVAR